MTVVPVEELPTPAVPNAASRFTGAQKAATLLLQLGREQASKVLAEMNESEVEEVTTEIVRLGKVAPEATEVVLHEFHSLMRQGALARGGLEVARELLEASLGRVRAASLLERVSRSPGKVPFAFLREADGRQLHNFLSGEHPQTVALVLAHLRPEQAVAAMTTLPAEMQADVARRFARMQRTSPEMIRAVAEILGRRTSSALAPVETEQVGGVDPLVEIINRADPGTEKSILDGLDERDIELAEEVRSLMFVFDDVLSLEDRAIQMVLRQVETNVLATALKGAKEEVTQKLLGNVSERAREAILEEVEMLGRVRLSAVEEARGEVVSIIRSLEAAGELVIRRDGEDEYIG